MVERSHDHWLWWRLSACSPVRLQQQLSVLQEVLQFCLLSVNQSEPSLELRPRPPCSDHTSELEPLRLWVTWSHGDRFQLQVGHQLMLAAASSCFTLSVPPSR